MKVSSELDVLGGPSWKERTLVSSSQGVDVAPSVKWQWKEGACAATRIASNVTEGLLVEATPRCGQTIRNSSVNNNNKIRGGPGLTDVLASAIYRSQWFSPRKGGRDAPLGIHDTNRTLSIYQTTCFCRPRSLDKSVAGRVFYSSSVSGLSCTCRHKVRSSRPSTFSSSQFYKWCSSLDCSATLFGWPQIYKFCLPKQFFFVFFFDFWHPAT